MPEPPAIPRQKLEAEIARAFSVDDLIMVLRHRLDITLEEVVGKDLTLGITIFQLIDWSLRRGRTPELVAALILERPDKPALKNAVEEYLKTPEAAAADPQVAIQQAEAAYLEHLARQFCYVDFKGIEQLEKWVSLPLDDVFVNLTLVPDEEGLQKREGEDELRQALATAQGDERARLEERLLEMETVAGPRGDGSSFGQTIDQLLANPGGLALLGEPGSGKTTLVKRLARSCALGPKTLQERYPDMPWCFPVVVPAAQFDSKGAGGPLMDYIRAWLREQGGEPLVRAWERHWQDNRCLVLVDGLDEVADTGQRIRVARCVDEFIRTAGQNRVAVSSRLVGYRICRLAAARLHARIQPFGPDDIEKFVRQWHLAYDRVLHPQSPRPEQAERDARELLQEVRTNPQVANLATNPLMLTIIALIKQQRVVLPERRVSLYETIPIPAFYGKRSRYWAVGRPRLALPGTLCLWSSGIRKLPRKSLIAWRTWGLGRQRVSPKMFQTCWLGYSCLLRVRGDIL